MTDDLASETIAEWFTERLPGDWFARPADVIADKDEILVVGTLPASDQEGHSDEGDELAHRERIIGFREATRDQRVLLASHAEALFARKVSWGARSGSTSMLFTHLTVPVMTRLRADERHVLDTLVAAGVAKSRSDALRWCVQLVGEHEGDWLAELRTALEAVEQVRSRRTTSA